MYEYRNKTLLEQLKLCKNTICKELDLKTKTKTLELLFKNSYKIQSNHATRNRKTTPALKRDICVKFIRIEIDGNLFWKNHTENPYYLYPKEDSKYHKL